jgi:AcrR family transcriptional regulator
MHSPPGPKTKSRKQAAPDTAANPGGRRPGRPLKSAEDAAITIRRAALEVFSRKGYQGASIGDIAAAAQVARPLIHYHFASKEEVWRAGIIDAVSTLKAELDQIQQAILLDQSEHTTKLIIRRLLGFAALHYHFVRIVVDETTKGGPRSEWLITNFLLPLYEIGGGLIAGFIKGPAIKGVNNPAQHLIPIIFGAVNFAFLDAEFIQRAYGADVFSKSYLDQHAELLARLFIPLIKQEAGG